jgi:hypothetical protein
VIESGALSPRSWPLRRSWNGEASPGVNRLRAKLLVALLLDEARAVKTATDRAAEAIEACRDDVPLDAENIRP